MAVDVTVRRDVFSVIYDSGFPELEAVIVDGQTLCLLSTEGKRIELGLLTPDVAKLATSCRIAIVVDMNGTYVNASKQVRLILS